MRFKDRSVIAGGLLGGWAGFALGRDRTDAIPGAFIGSLFAWTVVPDDPFHWPDSWGEWGTDDMEHFPPPGTVVTPPPLSTCPYFETCDPTLPHRYSPWLCHGLSCQGQPCTPQRCGGRVRA